MFHNIVLPHHDTSGSFGEARHFNHIAFGKIHADNMQLRKLIYIVSFYIAWYLAVVGSAQGHPLWGTFFVSAVIIGHLFASSSSVREEVIFIVTITILGSLVDAILPGYGLVSFASTPELPFSYPLWLLSLWALFAAMVGPLFSWLQNRPVLAAIIGGLGGPLSYAAGVAVGAIELHGSPLIIYGWNAVEWAVLFPLTMKIYKLLVSAKRR